MAAKYKVTSQVARPTFDGNSRPIDVFDVSFEVLPHGDRGMVTIPKNQYTPEVVAAEIQRLADSMAAVRDLGQG